MKLNDSNEAFLPTVYSEEFLPPINPWMVLGGLLQAAAVGIALVLAATLKYNVTVRAPATVRPTGEIRIVQASSEGTIGSIKVKENQRVNKGDVIAIVEDLRLQNEKKQLQGNLQQLERQFTQFDAQILALERQKIAETDRMNRTVASALAELKRSQREHEDRQENSVAEVEEAEANLRSEQKELQRFQADLKSGEANLKSVEAALKTAVSKRDRYEPIAETGALSQDQFEEAKLAVEQQAQAVAAQKGAIEAQKQAILRQQQVMEAVAARLQRTKTALNPSSAEVAIAQQRMAAEKATGEATLAALNREREALIQQRVEISKQQQRDRSQIRQIEADLTQTAIRATVNGTVLKLELRNPGQVVQLGDAIAQIAPDRTPIAIVTRVATQDISKVQICQEAKVENCQQGKVQLRISAYPYPDYGTLKGAVREISPDAIAPTNGDKSTGYYQVKIEAEKTYLVREEQQYPLQTGMEVTADIIAKEETILTFVLRKIRLIADV
ncbi:MULTISPECIES: biotin/lipoyl-binding protein [Kamptonema]|uniref:HlyD family efflux transporter periplasmic adaptor subunit n=1 Tax=Kamptonema TaxID=1501433 RepID=UPI0001DAD2A1|nr:MULTISPECIES: biotin/lipoyl-binding protein [Kamptonema]CBN59379.1 Secretion protein HlyD [Kamptonema sp. PCC 6506]